MVNCVVKWFTLISQTYSSCILVDWMFVLRGRCSPSLQAHVGPCGIIYSSLHLAGSSSWWSQEEADSIISHQFLASSSPHGCLDVCPPPPPPASSSGLTVDQTPVSCCFSMIYTQRVWVPLYITNKKHIPHVSAWCDGISTSSNACRGH